MIMWCSGTDSPGGSVVKNPPAKAGDTGDAGSVPVLRRYPGGGNGNPLQYSCLENSRVPFELRRKAGDCCRVAAGPIDLI